MADPWEAMRSEMMIPPSVIYLNSGSFGPTPRPVFERMLNLRRSLAADPMHFLLREQPPLLWAARVALAKFIGCRPERLVFQDGVTAAINTAAGLRLGGPGEILTSDREYPAMRWVWDRAAQRAGLTLREFHLPLTPRSPTDIIAAVEQSLTGRTRLLFISHVYSANGMIVPAKELCQLARSRGVLSVVDGAHAPGLLPLNVDDIGADIYAANCHKWTLGPISSGFFVLGANVLERLQPLQVSWGYRLAPGDLDTPDEFGMTPRIKQFEFDGTIDATPRLVLPEAIAFLQRYGLENIWQRMRELSSQARERLSGLRPMTPDHPDMHAAMTAYWWPNPTTVPALQAEMTKRNVEIAATQWPEGVGVRVACHGYTRPAEIERFAEIVRELV